MSRPPRRHETSRLEAFSDAVFGFALALSVGVMSLLVAALAPLEFAPISPMVYGAMGPAHGIYGMRLGRRRKAFETQLAGEEIPVASSPGF